ncbi:MAG: hypothetical protein P8179_05445 [Candidatus Thiodiazotropha sp.]
MTCALVVVQGKAQRRGIARYFKELQGCHAPLQVYHSHCSVIHPIGDHDHRGYFLQNQEPALEWSGQLIFLGSITVLEPVQGKALLRVLCYLGEYNHE